MGAEVTRRAGAGRYLARREAERGPGYPRRPDCGGAAEHSATRGPWFPGAFLRNSLIVPIFHGNPPPKGAR